MKGGVDVSQMDFNMLYQEHAEQVYKFLIRICGDADLAEDLLQDTFVKAIEKVDTFDNRCKFTTWLCQIAKNTYYDSLRKKQKHAVVGLPEEELAGNGPSLEEQIVDSQTAQEIRLIIHQLSEPYKEVFLLRFYAELSFREIGQIFGRSEVWGRVTYLRAREMILGMMEG